MGRKAYAYVRSHRRKWGFTQRELALLLGLSTPTAVSRIERTKRVPTSATVIACSIVFGLATPELFPSLHEEIEQAVCGAALALREELTGRTDGVAVRKRALLEEILGRVTSRKQLQKYEPGTH